MALGPGQGVVGQFSQSSRGADELQIVLDTTHGIFIHGAPDIRRAELCESVNHLVAQPGMVICYIEPP